MSLFDIDIKQDGDKVVFDFTNETSRLMRGFRANLERLCKEDFDRFAAANGYVKISDNDIIMPRSIARELVEGRCGACEDEGLSNCANCDLKPIRDRLEGNSNG